MRHEVVPGVSAAFAAAAAMNQELTIPEISQTVILTRLGGRTPVPGKEKLEALASHRASMVIYLSVQRIEKVVAELKVHYPVDTPAIVAYRVGWPDQKLIRGDPGEYSREGAGRKNRAPGDHPRWRGIQDKGSSRQKRTKGPSSMTKRSVINSGMPQNRSNPKTAIFALTPEGC